MAKLKQSFGKGNKKFKHEELRQWKRRKKNEFRFEHFFIYGGMALIDHSHTGLLLCLVGKKQKHFIGMVVGC
jgi:hypothetical protein